MKITMIKETKIPTEGLLKIKQIMDAVQKRSSLNPAIRTFEFELGGFGVELKNENDYLELVDMLKGLKEKAGIQYEITKFYIDSRGRKQPFTLYDSQKCKIKIADVENFENYHKKITQQCYDKGSSIKQANKIIKEDNLLLTKNLNPIITIGKLSAYNDGTIRYGKDIVKMRNQLKDLCRLFMRNPDRLLTMDDIKDEIIKADRRSLTPFITIAKYVSELHNLLKIHFGEDVIFNQKEEGWYFKLPK